MEQGSIHVNDVKQLIDEHERLLIEMPDELAILKQATVGYCVCRRPYDGFMIGCDHCDEWYHGPCIGISESKADRFEKFTCIRCSTKNVFNASATAAVGIIRKWTCQKDLKKARQIEHQKLQRKERKEKKDIDKFSNHIMQLENRLSELRRSDKLMDNHGAVMEFERMPQDNIIFGRDSIEKKTDIRTEQSDDPSANIVSVENDESGNDRILPDEMPAPNISKNAENLAEKGHESSVKGKQTNYLLCPSATNTSKLDANETSPLTLGEGEIFSKLEKAKAGLRLSQGRLKSICYQSQQRLLNESKEDGHSSTLRNWCMKVRSEVLAPSVGGQCEISRPPPSGTLSPVMDKCIAQAHQSGIFELSDVKKMIDCFKSICWSYSAMGVLRQKPMISQIRHLIAEASSFKLPDEKALRTMKFMANKGSQLQSKIEKALLPKGSDSKPINVSLLKELQCGIRESPLVIPVEKILQAVINDKGIRHCICGGPCHGRPMLFCNICKKKFHQECMEAEKSLSNGQSRWFCPCCKEQSNVNSHQLCFENDISNSEDSQCSSVCSKNDVSPHAPDPMDLWPPFGLLKSKTAIEAFGPQCSAIPDVMPADSNNLSKKITISVGRILPEIFAPKTETVLPESMPTLEVSGLNAKKISSYSSQRISCDTESRTDFSVSTTDANQKVDDAAPTFIRVPLLSSLQHDTKILNQKEHSEQQNQITHNVHVAKKQADLTGAIAEHCPEISR
mmetsp:Transcript_20188/g.41918  ORF Transcript_20188/g.41918 Transcript_20188/m.41918 type:complete len:734 (-) Transcript_20188:673-2874(-)